MEPTFEPRKFAARLEVALGGNLPPDDLRSLAFAVMGEAGAFGLTPEAGQAVAEELLRRAVAKPIRVRASSQAYAERGTPAT